jgi:hypothetical protein
MTKYLSLLVALTLFACSTPDEEIQRQALETILAEYEDCKVNSQSVRDCKNFVSRAICEYNGITDFMKDGEYVDYHEVFEIDEMKGAGNSYDFGARMYDSRLERWNSIDKVTKEWRVTPTTFTRKTLRYNEFTAMCVSGAIRHDLFS